MAEYAVHLPSGESSAESFFRLLGRIFTQSGVIQSGAMLVEAQGSPDMTVRLSGSATDDDAIFISTSNGNTYHGWNTADYNVTISANATGVTKKDTVIAYIDTALVSTTSDNPGGLKFTAVRGSGTDTAPTDGEINTAISSKPFIRLANVSVSNGASSINSGNIADVRTVSQIEGDRLETAGIARSKFAASALPIVYIHLGWHSNSPGSTYVNYDPLRTTIDFSKLITGATAAYFRATVNSGTPGQTSTFQLYNVTNGVAIAGSEVSTTSGGAVELTSGDVLANLPTTSKLMSIQGKVTSGAVSIHKATLEIHY